MSDPAHNPYQPPRNDAGDAPTANQGYGGYEIASRWTRFFGALIDGLLNFIVTAIGISMAGGEVFSLNPAVIARNAETSWWYSIPLAVLQWTLIARTGQSIGKRLVRTRVVKLDGSPANFVSAVVLRAWVLGGIFMLPTVARGLGVAVPAAVSSFMSLLALCDVLAIFGKERRCLHDLLAETKVVNAD